MKLYSDAPQASVKMSDDPTLVEAIESAIRKYGIRIAVETGTFQGTGSTQMIAECLRRAGQPIRYVTLEVCFDNWCIAYRNLRPYLFVDCRWGCSIDIKGAIEFIRKDDALNNHQRYPDIYIDHIEDPVGSYLKELSGMPSDFRVSQEADLTTKAGPTSRTKKWFKSLAESGPLGMYSSERQAKLRMTFWSGESLLPALLRLHHDNHPLVILDSAGGCGLYEFESLMSVMRDAPFLLLLDDTHHLKHFRSLRAIKGDSRFTLLNVSDYHGWALAWHE